MDPFDPCSLSEGELLRAGRDALWLERYREACAILAEYCGRLAKYERPISPTVLAYYGLAFGHSLNIREGLKICLEALNQDRRNPNIYICLARLYIFADSRKNAIEILRQGNRLFPGHRGLNALRKELGVRQAVPIPFLERRNAVNVRLGRALRKLKGKPGPAVA